MEPDIKRRFFGYLDALRVLTAFWRPDEGRLRKEPNEGRMSSARTLGRRRIIYFAAGAKAVWTLVMGRIKMRQLTIYRHRDTDIFRRLETVYQK